MSDAQPLPLQRKPKSSSERGRAFRERERAQVEALEQTVAELKRHVADQLFLRNVWEAKCLRSRHTKFGSLARLTEEYYSVVRLGVHGGHCAASGVDPVDFLSRVTHRDARLGDVVGPEGMVDQWKKYTNAHGMYVTSLRDIDVRGPEENPVVFARLETRVRFTRKTLETMFPRGIADTTLTQQLVGREITYQGTTLLRFSGDMQIVYQLVHFGFAEALVGAGIAVEDVERLLRGSRVSPTCTILDQPSVDRHREDVGQEWKC